MKIFLIGMMGSGKSSVGLILSQKLNYTFKEVILILDNFNYSLSSFAGYKKLNGAQLQKENITYP